MRRRHAEVPRAALPAELEWQREYDALLRMGTKDGSVKSLPAAQERRTHPRFPMRVSTVGLGQELQLPLVDASAAGVSFHCPWALAKGQPLRLVLAGAFSVEACVVACDAVGRPADPSVAWLAHCRFTDEDDGLRTLVLLRGIDEAEVSGDGV